MPADYPDRLTLYAIGRAHVLARANRIDPNQIDVQGSDVNIIVSSASFISYEVTKQLVQKINSLLSRGRIDSITGDQTREVDLWNGQLPEEGTEQAG